MSIKLNQISKPNLFFLLWTVAVTGLCILFASALFISHASAQQSPFGTGFDVFETKSSAAETLTATSWFKVKEGSRTGNLYVQVVVGDGYHTYSQNHGGVERKSKFEVPDSDQFKIVGPFEPDHPPHQYQQDGSAYETFEGTVVWSAPFTFVEGVDRNNLLIQVTYRGQACDENSCQPPITEKMDASFDGDDASLIVRAPTAGFDQPTQSDAPEELEVAAPETLEQAEALAALYDADAKVKYVRLDGSTGIGTFSTALFGAFVGGMLLNLMPCVFPVLGLKVMGFVVQAGNDPKKIKMHGIAFTLGLIFSMWVLAGAILGIKAFTGNEVNWGQQMGNPYFIGGVVILLFVLGLNLAGVFEMGLFMTRAGGSGQQKGYIGSFVSGIITTLVATPCSGPFLGTAMGYTLSQPPLVALFLFTIFGLGIAMPYLVMSFFPNLINLLPKPGPWMETFKKLMAFSLFAAAAFFAKSFGTLTGVDGLGLFLMAICVIALAAFFYGKYSPGDVNGSKRYVWGWVVPLLICAGATWMFVSAAQHKAPQLISDDGWHQWIPGRVEQQLAKQKPVWVDYTADW